MVMEISPDALGPGWLENQRRTPAKTREALKAPARAEVNFIPAPESLATLINSALAALKKGIFWDRGTILNLLV